MQSDGLITKWKWSSSHAWRGSLNSYRLFPWRDPQTSMKGWANMWVGPRLWQLNLKALAGFLDSSRLKSQRVTTNDTFPASSSQRTGLLIPLRKLGQPVFSQRRGGGAQDFTKAKKHWRRREEKKGKNSQCQRSSRSPHFFCFGGGLESENRKTSLLWHWTQLSNYLTSKDVGFFMKHKHQISFSQSQQFTVHEIPDHPQKARTYQDVFPFIRFCSTSMRCSKWSEERM